MSYCTGKNIEIARGKAVKMLVVEKKPVGVVADLKRYTVITYTPDIFKKNDILKNNEK